MADVPNSSALGGRHLPPPYHSADGITIYHGDIRELWPIEADVIVTDPPYGMDYRSKRGETVAGDRDTVLRDWLLEQWTDRPALVFGTWRRGRPLCRTLLIWDKGDSPGVGDCRLPWGPSHEEIYVCGGGWSNPKRRIGSVIKVPRWGGADRPDHPTPKPVSLMVHLLERCPAGVVLDPCMGSGSTLVAARQLGRQAIGVEIEERYCRMAVERLAQTTLPLDL